MAYPLPDPIEYLIAGAAIGTVIVLLVEGFIHLVDRYQDRHA